VTRRAILMAFVLCVLGGVVWFFAYQTRPPAAALDQLAALTRRAEIVEALNAAPTITSSLRKQRDATWAVNQSTLLQQPLSRQLARERAASHGHIRQIMVMDAGGALIAADAHTHDYDQSDESKWQRTVGAQTIAPVIEGRSREAGGIVWQMSQSVRAPDGHIIGAVTLRWR
jgi:hypothetical protein